MDTSVLVTGATGRVGRQVVEGLLRHGVRVRALVRVPRTAHLPDEVDVVEGDLLDPSTVVRAAAGMDSGFLLWPSFTSEGAAEIVDVLAREVSHIVYLSAGQMQEGRHGPMLGVWSQIEGLIERTHCPWTFVRAGGFAANTLGWAEEIRSGDVVRLTVPEAVRSLVHEHDIADVTVQAFVDLNHRGNAYEVTGPESLTQTEQLGHIADALGRHLRIEEQTRAELLEDSAPADRDFLDASFDYWETLVDDPETVRHDSEEVMGHHARSFSQWARDHIEDFK